MVEMGFVPKYRNIRTVFDIFPFFCNEEATKYNCNVNRKVLN